jgi:hypothetical protein
VGDSFETPALIAGTIVFFVLIGALYRHTMAGVARRSA